MSSNSKRTAKVKPLFYPSSRRKTDKVKFGLFALFVLPAIVAAGCVNPIFEPPGSKLIAAGAGTGAAPVDATPAADEPLNGDGENADNVDTNNIPDRYKILAHVTVHNLSTTIDINRVEFTATFNSGPKTNAVNPGPAKGGANEKGIYLTPHEWSIVAYYTEGGVAKSTPPVTKSLLALGAIGRTSHVWFYKAAGNGYVLDPADDGGTSPKDTGDLSDPPPLPGVGDPGPGDGLVTIINKSRSYEVTAAQVAGPNTRPFIVPITQGNSSTVIVPASATSYSISATVNGSTAVSIQPSSFFVREQTSKIFYLYKSLRSGGPVLTDNPEEGDINKNDLDPGGPASPNTGLGQETNEDERLDLSGNPNLAAVRVNNLSNILITGVTFADGTTTPYPMSQIQSKHNRSIILEAGKPYIVTISFRGADDYLGYDPTNTRTTTLTFQAYGTSKKINDIYFYLGKDKHYHVRPSHNPEDPYNYLNGDDGNGPPPDDKIDNGTTTPPEGDGEGGDPAGYPSFNKDRLGVLIVRNLTSVDPKGRALDKVEFFKGAYASAPAPISGEYYAWKPGPRQGDDKPILLRSGQWTIVMHWTKKTAPAAQADNPGDDPPKLKVKTIVQASLTPVNYCYFYIDTQGNHSIWTGNDFPADYDPANNNITTPKVGHGTIRVNNQSQAGSWIQEAEWMGLPYDNIDIPPNNSGDISDAPIGTSSIRFRIAGKTTFGSPMTITVRENQTTTVNYTDSMEESVLQRGYSQLRLFNNTGTSGATITKIRIVNRGMTSTAGDGTMIGNNGVIESTSFEPTPGPVTSGETKSVLIKNGESAANPNYVVMVTVQKSSRSFVVERPVYLNNSIATIELTAQDVADDSDKNVPKDPGSPGGGIRVYNSYARRYSDAGVVLIPEFKIYQYKLTPVQSTTTNYKWPDNATPPQTDPASAPIYVGGSGAIRDVAGGIYHLEVIAGTYPWHMYWGSLPAHTGGIPSGWPTTSNNVPLTVNLITYDCDEIWIIDGFESQYHFSPAEQERDTPNGFVIFYISNTSASDARSVSYVEIVKPDFRPWDGTSNNLWILDGRGGDATHLLFPSQGKSTIPATNKRAWPYNPNQTTDRTAAFAGWDDRRSAPRKNIVFSYGQAIARGTTAGPFIIPAGAYWCRYMDNYGSGEQWGRNSTQWRFVELTDNAGQIVYATLDNTTYFNWRGEVPNYDDTINPDTQAPWINTVNDLKVVNTASGTITVEWKRPSPYTNYAGARITVYKDGVQTPITSGVTVTTGTGSITYDTDGTIKYTGAATTSKITITGLSTGVYDVSVEARHTNGKFSSPLMESADL
jgi:hypothetical protein